MSTDENRQYQKHSEHLESQMDEVVSPAKNTDIYPPSGEIIRVGPEMSAAVFAPATNPELWSPEQTSIQIKWLSAATTWLRHPSHHTVERLLQQGLSLQASSNSAEKLFLGVQIGGFASFTADLQRKVSEQDVSMALDLVWLAAVEAVARPELHEPANELRRAVLAHYDSIQYRTFEVRVGYKGGGISGTGRPQEDKVVVVKNERVDVNLLRENSRWRLRVNAESGSFETAWNPAESSALVVNVLHQRWAGGNDRVGEPQDRRD